MSHRSMRYISGTFSRKRVQSVLDQKLSGYSTSGELEIYIIVLRVELVTVSARFIETEETSEMLKTS